MESSRLSLHANDMTMQFIDFDALRDGANRLAVSFSAREATESMEHLPSALPEAPRQLQATIDALAPIVLGGARRLDHPGFFAHMDPPTPSIAWVMTLWNAAVNQNLLHPDTAPTARELEERLMMWLCPFFGMAGGHMVPSSTVANLEALWAARELAGIEEIVASSAAHLSVRKAAAILRVPFRTIDVDERQRLRPEELGDVRRSAVVLTAGTTSSGAIDPLDAAEDAAWRHVDAAWAGPLRLSERYADRLAGIEHADSIAVSGHKLLFQPKDSGLLFFREAARAHAAISFEGAYLSAPNVGLMGSRGANAIPLLATLMSFGRSSMAELIERCMSLAERFALLVQASEEFQLFAAPESGCVLWRPRATEPHVVIERLRDAVVSTTAINGITWLRSVASNPFADPEKVFRAALASVQPHALTGA
ncbi:MAG: aspartate aminotransferase family protein [Candidatus Eremiobacteraeota bacterium]|nr:aspartate aminotransferase family protein [Candidatus Eremiobacteraeota bacterium]